LGDENKIGIRLYFALFFFVGIAIAVGLDLLFPEGGDDGAARPEAGAKEVELGERAGSADAWPSQHRAEALVGPGGAVDSQASTGSPMDKQGSTGSSMARVSLVTFLAMTVHNVPEGIAVFSAGVGGGKGAMLLAVAIALHNIPEGAAVAIPTYQTSKSFCRAFVMTFIAGIAQPLGAAGAWLILELCGADLKDHPRLMGAAKAITAGIMVCISLLELVPEALKGVSPLAVTLTMVAAFLVMEGTIIFGEIAEQASQ